MKLRLDEAFLAKPICHRALHDENAGTIENSREAIVAAIQAGLPLEVDVQNTSDGKAVVFHDHNLDRLTAEKGPVRERSLREMEAIPLEGGGKTISLEKCLYLVSRRTPILIEIKDQDGRLGPDLGNFLPDIIQNVRNYSGAIALMSFNPYIVQALKSELPETAIGLVTDPFHLKDWPLVPWSRRRRLRKLHEIRNLEYDFISHNWRDLKRVRDIEKPKLCWTIKSAEEEKTARQIADNITFECYMPEGV